MRKILLVALITTALPTFAQSSLTVDWDWKLSHYCSATSPALVVSGIPSETKSLRVAMVDLDFTSFKHGGGEVEHGGEPTVTIPEGVLKTYQGPCPRRHFHNFGHDYQITIKAIAADGQTELAHGSNTKTFSSKTAK